jgi:hypothetical protein
MARIDTVSAIYEPLHRAQQRDPSYLLQGVANLTYDELVEANFERGMHVCPHRMFGLSQERQGCDAPV